MAVLKALVTLASIAILTLSSVPLHVNGLAADRALVARQIHHHDAIAKRKRSDASGRCIPRLPSSLLSSSSTPTPTPTPTTSSSSAAPSASSSPGPKKWCLAWPNGGQWLENFAYLPNVKFIYDWSPSEPDPNNAFGLTFMPMLWGYNQISQFQQLVVPGYATYVLGPNEPNESNESNMSPEDAVQLWMTYINFLKDDGYTLVSPACTDSDDGYTWYQNFWSLCQQAGCHIDVFAFHAYTTDPNHLITFATNLHNLVGRPIMITEFADQNFSGSGGQPDMGQVWDYAKQVAPFVNDTPWIEAACPFGAMQDLQGVNPNNALMDSEGNPTSLAYFYFG